ncbi:MAG: hypothetical protein LBB18_03010 [Puniceicoccales bacterium]|jgi:hypothetical protein|nr:hypothetical protein [Puniceicoccales bacterium]
MKSEGYFLQDDNDEGLLFPMNEGNWHSYLAAIDAETGRFFKLFIENKHISNHLDVVFDAMQWGKIIFNGGGFMDGEEVEVVTFHKSPINIASRAIFFFMEKIWDIFVSECKSLNAAACWRLSKLMASMQREMLSGVASVDAGEYALGICHFKSVIAEVNCAIVAARGLPDDCEKATMFAKDFSVALFDIREIAWQSIMLCNISEKSHGEGPHFS